MKQLTPEEQKAVQYCIEKLAEVNGWENYSIIKTAVGDGYNFHSLPSIGRDPRYLGTMTLDLAWWAEVPIDDPITYLKALFKLVWGFELRMDGDLFHRTHIERVLKVVDSPILTRCQALYEAEGK